MYRTDGLVQLDWWYDTRSFEPYTVEELAEQFPLALIELTSEADAADRSDRAGCRSLTSLESDRNGTDPAITGEPSEEQLIQPSRPERVGPSSPAVERRTRLCASGVVPRRSRTGATSSPCLNGLGHRSDMTDTHQ